MVYGASDVATADAIVSAMTWHLDFLLNQNRDFPWKAVLAYHFEVHRHRHAAGRGFQPAAWYGQIANGPFLTNLNQPRPAEKLPPAGSTRATSAPRPAKPARTSDKSSELCNTWNAGGCAEPCRNGRRHACSACEEKHRAQTAHPKKTGNKGGARG